MLQVHGILETALYVKDIHRAAEFYRRLFGFKTLLESERLIALNVADRNVLLLFLEGATRQPFATEGGIIPGHSGSGPNHFAFSVDAKDLAGWRERLRTLSIPLESEVTWPAGSVSLYFRDPDQHLVELMSPGFWKLG